MVTGKSPLINSGSARNVGGRPYARVEIDIAIRTLAASYKNPLLRALDAIHLATAQLLATEMGESPAAFVTYDKRLLAAATAAGLPTASPGAAA
jgi:uncharacterized protein